MGTMTGFSIDVNPPGPVQGILTQEGQQVDRWEDVDLSKPWFWIPPVSTDPSPPPDSGAWQGWTELGYTED